MAVLQNGIHRLAMRLSLGWILILVVGLNVYWTLTLGAIGPQFQHIAGAPLLDLENVRGVLSADEATALLTSYSPAAQTFYWVFFILDNFIPLISFGSFAILWAYLLQRFPLRLESLAHSSLVLLPLGVGLFDILENLCFVIAMSGDPTSALTTVQIGLTFVNLKAICLFLTFGLTLLFAVIALVTQLQKRLTMTQTPSTNTV